MASQNKRNFPIRKRRNKHLPRMKCGVAGISSARMEGVVIERGLIRNKRIGAKAVMAPNLALLPMINKRWNGKVEVRAQLQKGVAQNHFPVLDGSDRR